MTHKSIDLTRGVLIHAGVIGDRKFAISVLFEGVCQHYEEVTLDKFIGAFTEAALGVGQSIAQAAYMAARFANADEDTFKALKGTVSGGIAHEVCEIRKKISDMSSDDRADVKRSADEMKITATKALLDVYKISREEDSDG